MKEKIVRIGDKKEGVALPEDYLRFLELIPGAEVEIRLDKKRRVIEISPTGTEDFLEHFKDSMESMA
ncbi:MAG TPA: hypothetical protein ENJ37_03615 [Deltaproteobacteria bacterium]|nr:hypothetical protein [Deltaproteobacteria bacterium]